tara:strand:+ start:408 stop:731 length:324 start_codon:yes stop_codon:yes gene_type:complete
MRFRKLRNYFRPIEQCILWCFDGWVIFELIQKRGIQNKVMKERILTGWSLTRWMYFGLGSVMLVHAIYSAEWFGFLFGGYVASMGLFAFGCASGVCANPNLAPEKKA